MNPYVYDPRKPTKFYPPNPIRPMATRASKRADKMARAISMAGEVLMTVCLAVGFYALVVFIFGVTP
jgi:hypothetical protein